MAEMDSLTRFIEHEGKTILLTDYKGIQGSDIVERVMRNKETILGLGKDQLILVDVAGCIATSEITNAFKDCASAIKPVVKKTAVIGLIGIQRLLLRSVNIVSHLDVNAFDKEEDALAWLVKD